MSSPSDVASVSDLHPDGDIVAIHNAVKRFGATTALNDLSMVIRDGESRGLVGRNGAGKSTLVSVLTGLQALDAGTVSLHGQPAPPIAAREEWLAKVSCVYQHRTLVPYLSVAENLFLGRYPGRGMINWRSLFAEAQQHLDRWGIPVSSRQKVTDLGVGEAQMVEIVRALASGTRFIILDEPTAQLVASEIDALVAQVNHLREEGVTFLFISHHLDEIPQMCDSVTVLRNGTDVLHGQASELSSADMVKAMVGGEAPAGPVARIPQARDAESPKSPTVLHVDKLSIADEVDEFSVTLRAGEIVGLAGHAGSGTRQIAMSLTGHRKDWTGEVQLAGSRLQPRRWDSARAVQRGVTLVPEDRIKSGLVAQMSIEDNVTLTTLRGLTRRVLLDRRGQRAAAERARTELGVKCASVRQPVGELSGGNQQKVLLGAALGPQPQVLVLMHPTAGVDIASKATIMQIVEEHRAEGLAVLLVSDEPEELAICDRVQVWVRGRLAMEGQHLPKDELVAAMEGSFEDAASSPRTAVPAPRDTPESHKEVSR